MNGSESDSRGQLERFNDRPGKCFSLSAQRMLNALTALGDMGVAALRDDSKSLLIGK